MSDEKKLSERVRPNVEAAPSILLPQQRCKVCGYRDPRPRQQSEGE